MSKAEEKNYVANEVAIYIIYKAMQEFNLTGSEAVKVFDKNNLWQLINDTDVLCLLAHDNSVEDTIQMIGDIINEKRN